MSDASYTQVTGKLINRQDVIDVFDGCAELLRHVLDDADIVGAERRKYKWGLGLIESCISDMKKLPSAEPEERTKERTETHACDCISRQAAIDCVCYDQEYTIECLEKLPSAQLERKKGKWIEHNPHKFGLGIVFECSECGEKIDCEEYNFCPNCEAKMER